MRALSLSSNIKKGIAILFTILALAFAFNVPVEARHAAPSPPTNLVDSISRTYPATHTLHWNPISSPPSGSYYVVFQDGNRVGQTTATQFALNNGTMNSGYYTVRAADNSHGFETMSGDSNSIYVTLGYLWSTTGSPWNSCFTPGAPTPPGPYDGCFTAGTYMYALRNVNVKYRADHVRSGNGWMKVYYRQKFAQLPTGFTKYDVNVIVGGGTNWQYITTLQLPAGAPDVVKSVTIPVSIAIDRPGEVELQWVNDTVNNGGDANLQIDYVELSRS